MVCICLFNPDMAGVVLFVSLYLLHDITVVNIESSDDDNIEEKMRVCKILACLRSTTYQIIKYLRDLAHTQQTTTLIALLQPAPETYELFDDVMLIADGDIFRLSFLRLW